MDIIEHTGGNFRIAELVADGFILNSIEDGTALAGNLNYQGYDTVIIDKENIAPHFFDLSTRMLGEIAQKFSNFRMRLCIIGDFSDIQSISLREYITECNKGNHVNFFTDSITALQHIIPQQ